MRNKKIVGAGVAVAASAALLLAGSPALADEESFVDSAYAISASGLLDIDPLPAGVESVDGEPISKEVLGLGERTSDAQANGIFVGVLNASAEAGRSEASVARVELLDILRADVIRTHCEDADPDLSGLQIINGTLLGQPLPETPVPSTEINLSPLATVTLNDQVRNADGSLTVTGIELKVLPGRDDDVNETLDAGDRAALPGLGDLLGVELPTTLLTEQDVLDQLAVGPGRTLQTVTIGSATCTELGDDDGDGNNDEDNGDKGDDGSDDAGDDSDEADGATTDAPAPTVVQADLPVTG
ncbi:choice-of-anchor P family protein [Pseudonocardia saturnea]